MTLQEANILFELEYIPDEPQVDSGNGRPGHYIGSGIGTATIGQAQGTVRWDLFEDQAPGKCAASFVGTVKLENDEVVEFETDGWLHVPDPRSPHIWEATGHRVSFRAVGERTGWLNGMSGNWTGTFDASLYKHRYVVSI